MSNMYGRGAMSLQSVQSQPLIQNIDLPYITESAESRKRNIHFAVLLFINSFELNKEHAQSVPVTIDGTTFVPFLPENIRTILHDSGEQTFVDCLKQLIIYIKTVTNEYHRVDIILKFAIGSILLKDMSVLDEYQDYKRQLREFVKEVFIKNEMVKLCKCSMEEVNLNLKLSENVCTLFLKDYFRDEDYTNVVAQVLYKLKECPTLDKIFLRCIFNIFTMSKSPDVYNGIINDIDTLEHFISDANKERGSLNPLSYAEIRKKLTNYTNDLYINFEFLKRCQLEHRYTSCKKTLNDVKTILSDLLESSEPDEDKRYVMVHKHMLMALRITNMCPSIYDLLLPVLKPTIHSLEFLDGLDEDYPEYKEDLNYLSIYINAILPKTKIPRVGGRKRSKKNKNNKNRKRTNRLKFNL
jgi:hypothetical protein